MIIEHFKKKQANSPTFNWIIWPDFSLFNKHAESTWTHCHFTVKPEEQADNMSIKWKVTCPVTFVTTPGLMDLEWVVAEGRYTDTNQTNMYPLWTLNIMVSNNRNLLASRGSPIFRCQPLVFGGIFTHHLGLTSWLTTQDAIVACEVLGSAANFIGGVKVSHRRITTPKIHVDFFWFKVQIKVDGFLGRSWLPVTVSTKLKLHKNHCWHGGSKQNNTLKNSYVEPGKMRWMEDDFPDFNWVIFRFQPLSFQGVCFKNKVGENHSFGHSLIHG